MKKWSFPRRLQFPTLAYPRFHFSDKSGIGSKLEGTQRGPAAGLKASYSRQLRLSGQTGLKRTYSQCTAEAGGEERVLSLSWLWQDWLCWLPGSCDSIKKMKIFRIQCGIAQKNRTDSLIINLKSVFFITIHSNFNIFHFLTRYMISESMWLFWAIPYSKDFKFFMLPHKPGTWHDQDFWHYLGAWHDPGTLHDTGMQKKWAASVSHLGPNFFLKRLKTKAYCIWREMVILL